MMETDKVAIVTGTSSGIGFAIANTLLARGFVVYGGSRRSTQIDHPNFVDCELDVRSEESVVEFYNEIKAETEVVDLLVNNAGICEMSAFEDTDSKDIINHFETNVMGTYYNLKYFEPLIIEEETQIINIMSVSAKYSYPNTASFTMTEFGKRGLLDVISKEWAKYKVRINNMYLGAIKTALWDEYDDESMDTDKMLTVDEFLYSFHMLLDAPENMQIPEITLLHKDGFLT